MANKTSLFVYSLLLWAAIMVLLFPNSLVLCTLLIALPIMLVAVLAMLPIVIKAVVYALVGDKE